MDLKKANKLLKKIQAIINQSDDEYNDDYRCDWCIKDYYDDGEGQCENCQTKQSTHFIYDKYTKIENLMSKYYDQN